MDISDDTKRQVQAAVSNKALAMLREHQPNGIDVPESRLFTPAPPAKAHSYEFICPIPESVHRAAMDSIGRTENIRLAQQTDEVFAPRTPTQQTWEMATRMTRMRHLERDADALHAALIKDHYGKERYADR